MTWKIKVLNQDIMKTSPKMRRFFLVFFLANLLLASFHTDLWQNPNNLLTIFFDMSPVTAMYFWLILFTGITFVLYRWFKNIQHQEMNISNSVFADKKQHVS